MRYLLLTVVAVWWSTAARSAEESAIVQWAEVSSENCTVQFLGRDGQLSAEWGLTAGKRLPAGMPVVGVVDGKAWTAADLQLVSLEEDLIARPATPMVAVLRHRTVPIEFRVRCIARGKTGVITCDVEIINHSDKTVELTGLASFASPIGTGTLHSMQIKNGVEWNLVTDKLSDKPLELGNDDLGRSSATMSPWWALYEPSINATLVAELEYSGNWTAQFTPTDQGFECRYGMTFDNGGPLRLAPGASFTLPTVAIAIHPGDNLDGPARAQHRYQRQFVIPKRPEGVPLLVQFNTWYSHNQHIDHQLISDMIPRAAAIGCEAFVIDAGWYTTASGKGKNWKAMSGDWAIDRKKFPEGLRPIIDQTHAAGMKFGLWLEPEPVGLQTETAKQHPEWYLSYKGKLVVVQDRLHLDYAQPEVRAHMHAVVDRLMQEGTIDWVKLDYNTSIGGKFDITSKSIGNTRLHDHLRGYYQWLRELREKYPNLVVENCSSGALRWDTGILGQTHTSWISDTVNPRYAPQMVWGSLLQSPCEVCNHWMAGDTPQGKRYATGGALGNDDPGWWQFMHLVAMNGQYGVSARLDQWPDEAVKLAAREVSRYKQLRDIMDGADVYHLTPQPAQSDSPTDWFAIEYLQPSTDHGVVMAYRLEQSPATKSFPLRGLTPGATYKVTIGDFDPKELSAEQLEQGLEVELEQEWRGVAIRLEKKG